MNSTSASDASLYEIALSSDQPSLVLQISPATLKSVVSSFIDLLVEQKIPAIVWAKLPRGDIWQDELERYLALPGVSRAIYQFKNYRDESGLEERGEDAGMNSTAITAASPAPSDRPGPVGQPVPDNGSGQAIASILLAPDSHLRREYCLVVWSTEFQGMVLAHRPRSAQIMKSTSGTSDSSPGQPGTGSGAEDGQEKRQNLLAMISLDPGLISRILTGLESAAAFSQARLAAETGTAQPDELPDSVRQWQALMATMPAAEANPCLLGKLLTQQIQQQEEFWQRSITYRKQAEIAEVLQVQNAELSNAIRLKDDFLNNVGQELRTPLTTIKTALTLLNSPNIKPPQRQRYMDLIAKECDRQSSLITSLLDLVQLEQVVDQSSLQPVRLAEVVPGVVSTYQPVAEEKGVMLAYTVPEDLPPVSCMSNWLKQIVINLLNNGIKYTPTGGQVWVRAKRQGDYVQLEFRDTGIGIASSEVPKIFERFYRVRQASEESASGAGLGLTIVQQLLIHCGGSISVRSKPGEGSTFNVLLPVHRSALDASSE
ncbi:histidine kinase [Leptothermofonsia sichuanensis E412]|uniref:ATP-binding protein n=1 Tax=Leptothermofonsia sichuanensis TaxID=2917832 RepID=UPI001CA7B19B|nr:ATP-binding protein [Leptothermofonsia sichuanensis]QZZ18684.1 histidine kinase [Leptothermofonsia sichuanensis E412]